MLFLRIFYHPPAMTMTVEAAFWGEVFFSTSVKWGCFGIPKTLRIDSTKLYRTGRSSWLFAKPLPAQLRPALPTSKMRRKWTKGSHYTNTYTPPVSGPFPQCICLRVKACETPSRWSTVTARAISVGQVMAMVWHRRKHGHIVVSLLCYK